MRVPPLVLSALVGVAGCTGGASPRPADDDVAAGVADFYAREAGLHELHLARTHLLTLGADPSDADAWVALVAVRGAVGQPARAIDDTLEVLLRPGTDRLWTSEVRSASSLPLPDSVQ